MAGVTTLVVRSKMPVKIRQLKSSDVSLILPIDSEESGEPRGKDQIAAFLKGGQGFIAEDWQRQPQPVGFLLYSVEKGQLEARKLAVSPNCWRKGVGTELLKALKSRMGSHRCTSIRAQVRETNLAVELLLRSQRFLATGIWRKHYKDSGEDAFIFEFLVDEE